MALFRAGSDGRIRIWNDVSEKKREEELKIAAERVHNEQILSNFVERQQFDKALEYSLTLSKSYK